MPKKRTSSRTINQTLAWVALLPMAATVLVAYLGTVLWTIKVSLTQSRTFPSDKWAGLSQYERLFDDDRWLLSTQNLAIYGVLFVVACVTVGLLLAIFIDQKVRAEGALRTVFLYPYAMSFVATGLIWQWLLNPTYGIQQTVRELGWSDFTFDWILDQDKVIYTIVFATVWQTAGLVMAMLLAALRGVDEEIWKAARLDGIPVWRVYVSVVLPMLTPALATVLVLLFTSVVKLFDAVVAMTQGGPGIASEVPTKYIMDHLFGRANLGLASAGAVVLLATVMALIAPLLYVRNRRARLEAAHG